MDYTVTPNPWLNRPATAGGVRLARDSGEAAARQPYAACRSGPVSSNVRRFS